ncbi:MAG: hypothetical protein WC761_05035 [Candidatus Paceibacterota bacterium]|jgi:hypothetical protein
MAKSHRSSTTTVMKIPNHFSVEARGERHGSITSVDVCKEDGKPVVRFTPEEGADFIREFNVGNTISSLEGALWASAAILGLVGTDQRYSARVCVPEGLYEELYRDFSSRQ